MPHPLRIMFLGYPKAGKTGALACLAEAGYNIRVLDFDHNLDPLRNFCSAEAQARIEAVTLADAMKFGADGFEPIGKPDAFAKALRMLDGWKLVGPDGKEIDRGPVKTWTDRDILVLDSLTSCGDAAFNYIMHINGRTARNLRRQDHGSAMRLQDGMLSRLTAPNVPCHVIVLSHLKMVGPKDIEKDDNEVTKDLKERMAELVPTKLFPSALGQALPPLISGHFPILILAETVEQNGKVLRKIRTKPKLGLDLGVPSAKIPELLPQDTGLLTIFNELLTRDDKVAAREAA